MEIVKQSKAAGSAYPLNLVKDHLRTNGYGEEDALTQAYLSAAVDYIQSNTWVYLQSCNYVGYMDYFQNFTIKMHPVTEITSIKYYDVNGTLQTMVAGTDYYVSLNGDFARVKFENTFTLRDQPFDNIEVTFKAGYLTHFEIPDDIVNAMLIIIADSYEMRQSFSQGVTYTDTNVPMGAKAILDNNSKRTFV